jgi:hypothetical protein
MREIYMAWILSSYAQYEVARGHFEDEYDYFSSSLHITYTLGRVGRHNVVVASPASKTVTLTIDLIANNLLLYFPSIVAGFVVSTNACVLRESRVKIGDVVIGGKLPNIAQSGVVYVDAEKTNKEKRLFMTGESGNIPAAIASAVKELRSKEDWDGCIQSPGELEYSPERLQSKAGDQRKPQAQYGTIISSRQQITDSVAKQTITNQRDFLCFETAASTMKMRPLLLLAGITSYCGETGDPSAHERACKAVISYLTRLTQRISRLELQLEPAIMEYLEYEAMDLERPAFRLLRLQGGTGPLQCHIFQAYLPSDKKTLDDEIHDKTVLMPYEALSYCWGSNELSHTIRVNGKILLITSNLFQALRNLRLADRDRILWIDAICIDQHNILERGHQVDMMGRLYGQAEGVLIWLGDIGDSGGLISTLQTFETNVPNEARRQWASNDVRYGDLWIRARYSSLEDEISLQSKMEHLTQNSWFSRVWIIQEVAEAKKASLGCTDGWIDARTFAVGPKLLQITPNTQCQAIIDIMPGTSRMSSWFGRGPDLSTLLWRFRESEASDPRDRLYALLGISSDKPIAADYSKTEQDVVKEMIRYYFQEESILQSPSHWAIKTIPKLVSDELEQRIRRGLDLDYLQRFATRYTGQLLFGIDTIEYLRYVRSPLLRQLVRQGCLISLNGETPLASILDEGKKFQVTRKLLDISRQNGISFVSALLDPDRDDIVMNHDLAMEAISNGPSVLKRFLDKYDNKTKSTEDNGQIMLRNLKMLQGSFTCAGVVTRPSGE